MEKMIITLIVLTAAIYLIRQLFAPTGSSQCAGCGQKNGCCSCSGQDENGADLPSDGDESQD